MSRRANLASKSDGSFVGTLAQLFPDVTAVRIPVRVTGADVHGVHFEESTVIEFGTPMEVFFASKLPLEFGEMVRLKNSDRSLDAEAAIVAVQYHNGRKAVAARFARKISNWIIKK